MATGEWRCSFDNVNELGSVEIDYPRRVNGAVVGDAGSGAPKVSKSCS